MRLDGLYSLETPENVEVQFELAGPGSRFCAMAIDALLAWLAVACIAVFSAVAGILSSYWLNRLERDVEEGIISWAWAFLILIISMVLFGYHAFFELVMSGQTPGKRALKIRAIRDDGTPLTPLDVMVRNIVRIADFLPAFYGLGGLVAMIHPMHKRLGDLAAGTMVVKEAELDYRAMADKKYTMPEVQVAAANAELTPDERRVIQSFLQRRSELLPDARAALASRISQPLHAKYGGLFTSAEQYLERLIEGRHRGP